MGIKHEIDGAGRKERAASHVVCFQTFVQAVLYTWFYQSVLLQLHGPTPAALFLPPSPAPAPAPHFVNLTDLLSLAGPFHTFLHYFLETQAMDTLRSEPGKQHQTRHHHLQFVPKDSAFASLNQTFVQAVLYTWFYQSVLLQLHGPTPAALFLPPSPAPAPAPHFVNLTDLLSLAGPFHTFLHYLLETQAMDTLRSEPGKQHQTRHHHLQFVPKDSAFASLNVSDIGSLTQDQLRTLLLYHVLPDYHSLSEFKNLSKLNHVSTCAGGRYVLNVTDTSGRINIGSSWTKNAEIASSVYSTALVAVYEIDGILLPLGLFSSDPHLAPAPGPAPAAKKGSDVAPTGGPAPESSTYQWWIFMRRRRWFNLESLFLDSFWCFDACYNAM
ncbi:fasciclin-like arabinogalactan protein 7 [Canna indica]|uniref:Fasciclin-like arabinogalactan protein 7 n=1 Tax=Canna indica TaxID=4628 RepID=A0AAQ3JN72_9LILI|nr:fasciclin-like arabinogalactan protein 7 [Canna indica]